MSLVFQNIDPHHSLCPASVYLCWGGGGGVEDIGLPSYSNNLSMGVALSGTLLQDLTQDSGTLTGWRRTKRSGDGKMIALYSPGICGLRYRSFP
jgi:hypothetical protein